MTPAERASEEALSKLQECLLKNKSFIFEAGAGAGKTYSLIEALKFTLKLKERELSLNSQQIACVTYTNVAKYEIENRLNKSPLVFASTIHSFCWGLIKNFQSSIKSILMADERWIQRFIEFDVSSHTKVEYDLGYPKVQNGIIMLGHDDVIDLTVVLLDNRKFQAILKNKFPVIFIDEYQDTEKDFVDAIKKNFLQENKGPLLGFFGDHWQKIYPSGCGKIEHSSLSIIGKGANFRSKKIIVDCLNIMRPELEQEPYSLDAQGTIHVFHTNSWDGARRTDNHWQGDLPSKNAHEYLDKVKSILESKEWSFSSGNTKILMLTHNVLSEEQGYKSISSIYDRAESYIKREDVYIDFLISTIEELVSAYDQNRIGDMFLTIGEKTVSLKSHSEKKLWKENMSTISDIRENGTIGDMIEYLKLNRPRLPEKIIRLEKELDTYKCKINENADQADRKLEKIIKLKKVKYDELICLANYVNNKTPFSTKHGVKGAEFDNVLVVVGRGWNHYNFNQMLEWASLGVPSSKEGMFERNRNLFYVACSRPRTNLALLFTQKLTGEAINTLNNWFGKECVLSI